MHKYRQLYDMPAHFAQLQKKTACAHLPHVRLRSSPSQTYNCVTCKLTSCETESTFFKGKQLFKYDSLLPWCLTCSYCSPFSVL